MILPWSCWLGLVESRMIVSIYPKVLNHFLSTYYNIYIYLSLSKHIISTHIHVYPYLSISIHIYPSPWNPTWSPEVFTLALVYQLSAACANDCSTDQMVMSGGDLASNTGFEVEFRLIDVGWCEFRRKPTMDSVRWKEHHWQGQIYVGFWWCVFCYIFAA